MFLFKSANTSKVIYRQKWLMMSEHGRNVALFVPQSYDKFVMRFINFEAIE
jgi:hypothetical protein